MKKLSAGQKFHYIDMGSDEYATWIELDKVSESVRKFVEDTPDGEEIYITHHQPTGSIQLLHLDIGTADRGKPVRGITLHVKDILESGFKFFFDNFCDFESDQIFTIDLNREYSSKNELTALQVLHPGEVFIKDSKSAKDYNEWLQWHSDEDLVFPKVCPKCGHLMSCTREYWENHDNWRKLTCTNDECRWREFKPKLLATIKESNQAKFDKGKAQDLIHFAKEGSLEIFTGDDAHQRASKLEYGVGAVPIGEDPKEPPSVLTDRCDKCQHCGSDDVKVAHLIKFKNGYQASIQCQRCKAGLSSVYSYPVKKKKTRKPSKK